MCSNKVDTSASRFMAARAITGSKSDTAITGQMAVPVTTSMYYRVSGVPTLSVIVPEVKTGSSFIKSYRQLGF